LGKGRIYSVASLAEVFADEKIAPDFSYDAGAKRTELGFLHRSTGDSETYFISNRQDRDENVECTFRVAGKRPELWNAVTGESRPAVAFKQVGGLTTIPLRFDPYGSIFVIFREPIGAEVKGEGTTNFPIYTDGAEIQGPWAVSFDPKWGGPSNVEFDKLESWTTRPEDGLKYYSGTATYRKTFDLPSSMQGSNTRIALDLGEVKYVALVRLNGKDLGAVWTKPFRIDITDAASPTGNVLEIDVANLWPNRIIGDSLLPPERRFTHTNIVYTRDTPLWESGLLGPVRLQLIEGVGR
jgi:hypothetical protein